MNPYNCVIFYLKSKDVIICKQKNAEKKMTQTIIYKTLTSETTNCSLTPAPNRPNKGLLIHTQYSVKKIHESQVKIRVFLLININSFEFNQK